MCVNRVCEAVRCANAGDSYPTSRECEERISESANAFYGQTSNHHPASPRAHLPQDSLGEVLSQRLHADIDAALRAEIEEWKTNAWLDRMNTLEKIRAALEGKKATVTNGPAGEMFVNVSEQIVEVYPTDSLQDIKAKMQNPFERETMSVINRIKQKALQAKNVAPEALKEFEADLDGILAEKSVIAEKRAAAVAPHHEAISGIKGELEGLKSAIDILSNDPPA